MSDVAREAGVAVSTVSRTYARPGRVGTDTARRVREAAERIGYSPTPRPARAAAPGSRRRIGLVVSDVTNPFYGEIITGATVAARQTGHRLVLLHTGEQAERERATVEGAATRLDGLVIASSRMSDADLADLAARTTVVLLNRTVPGVACVVADTARGVRAVAEHLAGLGHRSLLYLAGPSSSRTDLLRGQTLERVGRELGLRVQRTGPHDPTLTAGVTAAAQVASTGATAVVAFNDALAVGVMRGLRACGTAVPDEVSVAGFDDVALSSLVDPALTSVAAPLRRMGATGVRNCVAVAHGARPTGVPLVMPVRLVPRASTAPAPAPTPAPAPVPGIAPI
jgi:LacI family transcriptional regulator